MPTLRLKSPTPRNLIRKFTNGFLVPPERINLSIYQPELGENAFATDDWLKLQRPFRETPIFKAFQQHFVEGTPWRDTEYYSKLECGFLAKRLGKFDGNIDRFLESYEQLYESIRNDGYDTSPKRRPLTVLGGRGTDLIRIDGNHRLAIALLLEVPRVRARYRFIHKEHIRQDGFF